MNIKNYITRDGNKWYLRVKVTPKSPKTEVFAVLDDDTVKIRLRAIPEKWKANMELINFLAKELEIRKNSIELISWATDKIKLIRINYS